MKGRSRAFTLRLQNLPTDTLTWASRWLVEMLSVFVCCKRILNTKLQISVVNDMSAIPISMAKSLSKAKGCYGDAAQGPKQAAYSAASLVTQKKK